MKPFALILMVALSRLVFAQEILNLQLLAHYNDTTLPKRGDQIWNDVMGWKDTVKNREYMIAGTTDSIYFFDITNPAEMKICSRFWGTNTGCVNRDYYPYSHYLYATSDQCTNPGNLQIFDMQYLPDSVVKVYEDDTLGAQTHTIFIEPKSKRMYMNLNAIWNPATLNYKVYAMDIISLENPIQPKRIGRLQYPAPFTGTRVHESYARHDTVYCSSENKGLFIWDVRNAEQPVFISAITPPYPQNAYNHSNWLDSSGKYILFCDETPAGVGMKIYDISNITQPVIVNQPFKEIGSPHNAYWMGKYAYASMYYGGVQVYDLSDVNNPKIAAYYDTYPLSYNDGYKGCWGVWPFLPSGNILASDMSFGLFVLKPTDKLGLNNQKYLANKLLRCWPNPVTDKITFTLPNQPNQTAKVEVLDVLGHTVWQQQLALDAQQTNYNVELPIDNGFYFVRITTKDAYFSNRIIKQ